MTGSVTYQALPGLRAEGASHGATPGRGRKVYFPFNLTHFRPLSFLSNFNLTLNFIFCPSFFIDGSALSRGSFFLGSALSRGSFFLGSALAVLLHRLCSLSRVLLHRLYSLSPGSFFIDSALAGPSSVALLSRVLLYRLCSRGSFFIGSRGVPGERLCFSFSSSSRRLFDAPSDRNRRDGRGCVGQFNAPPSFPLLHRLPYLHHRFLLSRCLSLHHCSLLCRRISFTLAALSLRRLGLSPALPSALLRFAPLQLVTLLFSFSILKSIPWHSHQETLTPPTVVPTPALDANDVYRPRMYKPEDEEQTNLPLQQEWIDALSDTHPLPRPDRDN
ncbi:hypothetical protein Sjap_018234 [Stephania japonica]|uniref:Uncharacterized protein n=1 Tax=Stephania japonica TaxID=461633 RepID=A0AAP0I7K7_9MAGN